MSESVYNFKSGALRRAAKVDSGMTRVLFMGDSVEWYDEQRQQWRRKQSMNGEPYECFVWDDENGEWAPDEQATD